MDRTTLSTHLRLLGLSEQDAKAYITRGEHGESATTVLTDLATVDETDTEAITDGGEPGPQNVSDQPFEALPDRASTLEQIAALIEGATEEVALSVPAAALDELEEELRDAVDRGVLVVLLVSGDEKLTAARFEGIANVARIWSKEAPLLATIDYQWGVMAPSAILTDTESDGGIVLEHRQLTFVLMGSFFGNYWRLATQVFAADPAPLPRTYTNIRQAVFQASLLLDADTDTDVHVTAEARPVGVEAFDTVEGRLVDVRQSLLEPVRESFAIENALILERCPAGDDSEDDTEGERITLGGMGAFVEEFRTRSVTLSALE